MPKHFPPQTLKFLRGLARNNDRDWFNARKDVYESTVKAPMMALVEEINAALEDVAPEHVRPAQKVMMRIYRDTRFSKNKLPYKTNIAAWWARRGMEKTSGGGFYLHISPQEVMISAGVYMPEREQLLAIRRYLADEHASYRKLYTKLLRAKKDNWTPIDAQALSRTPKGFAKDGPAEDLIRARNWGVHALLPASLAEEPKFAREIVRRFAAAAPLVALLNTPLLPDEGATKRASALTF